MLVLRAGPNGLDVCRFGFAVSKGVGKAVVRNRVRRRLREAVGGLPVRGGRDVLLIARRPIVDATYWDIKSAAADLLGRIGILEVTQKRKEEAS